jgi:hypothetical protein
MVKNQYAENVCDYISDRKTLNVTGNERGVGMSTIMFSLVLETLIY